MTDAHNPVELAQALIRCRSVTPEEGGALRLLEDVLRKAGFETHFLTFSEPGTPDVSNLYARIGSGKPVFVFAGHTDVVPPGDESTWSHPPFSGTVEDGILYGRGAVDMKGGVAATVSAALRYLAAGGGNGKGSIVFLITGDEEGPSINGMPKLLAWAKERGDVFDHCLLAEPSSAQQVGDEIKIGRRGSLSGIVTVHGKQGHVAYPKQADNPIRRLIAVMEAMHQPLDYGTANFERSNLEITSVDVGNETVNVIPAKATARFNLRFNDAHTLTSVKGLLAERLERAAAGAKLELTFLPGASSSFSGAAGSFVDLVSGAANQATGIRPKLSTAGGTSDARYIKDYCPVLELGLVNATMHQVDEKVPVKDLETATRMYERILEHYFGAVVAPPEMKGLAPQVESDLEAALAAELDLGKP